MDFSGLSEATEQWGTVWAAVGALATLATAMVAIITLLAIKRDSLDRTRPLVVADLRWPPLEQQQMNLVIWNAGKSVARDVRVTFTPEPLVDPADEREPTLARSIVDRYASPLPMLPPGGRLSNIWWTANLGQARNLEPLPDAFVVHVSYRRGRRRRYRDDFPLSIERIMGETFGRPSKANTDRIESALEAIARGLGSN